MAEMEEIFLNLKTYDEMLDKGYGIYRFYRQGNKVNLAYFNGPGYCEYRNFNLTKDNIMGVYNVLFSMHHAYSGLSDRRKKELIEDPTYQYIIHKSNYFLAQYLDEGVLNGLDDIAYKNQLIKALKIMRMVFNLPEEVTEEEEDLLMGLRNQAYKEMDRQMANPDKLATVKDLLENAREIQKINQRYNDLDKYAKLKRGNL